MAKPIHSMIRVLDEARSIDFYRRAFGLEIADRYACAPPKASSSSS
jgi:lactoylglutathione lyase